MHPQLDHTRPVSEVWGVTDDEPFAGARYYQEGRYYRADGTFIWAEDAHHSSPPPDAPRDADAPRGALAEPPAGDADAPRHAVAEPPSGDAGDAGSSGPQGNGHDAGGPGESVETAREVRRKQLLRLPYGTIAKMVTMAGGQPMTGPGAVTRMAQWLLDRTS